ncbi:hypothetical protein AX16_006296 [Volvariella volvacea WC 439]|nr:hypothetical protein AX16_006296 [Volvariella volvacea WC 439]
MSTVPTTQKALFLDAPHGNFVVNETEVYTPKAGELLVKIHSAAINPIEWKVQKFDFFVTHYPAILGTDIAGDVVKVGEGVTRFQAGDKVFFQGAFVNRSASYQQYTVAEEALAAKIPENITYDDAATIPVTFTCAYVALYQTFGLIPPTPSRGGIGKYAGIPFVVIGGSSSVGQYALQLAKLSGFSPIITYSSSRHEPFLKSLGATHVIDRAAVPVESLPSVVHEITGLETIPWALDVISSDDTQQAGYDLLSNGGKLGVVVYPSKTLKEKEGSRKGVTTVVGFRNNPEIRSTLLEMYQFLEGWIRNGTIKPNSAEVVPGGLNGIVPALKRLEANEVSGVKLVFRPQEE